MVDSVEMWLYINLNTSITRKENIENELNKVTKNFKRIEATQDENTVLGCLKSHLKAIEFAKQNQYRNVAILEDDFSFENLDMLETNLKNIFNFKQWDAAELWVSERGKPYVKKISDNEKNFVVYRCFNTVGTVGYIVKNHLYDKIIKSFQNAIETKTASDLALWSLQRNTIWITVYPYIGKHNEGISTISKSFKKQIFGFNPNV